MNAPGLDAMNALIQFIRCCAVDAVRAEAEEDDDDDDDDP